jgi:hypothetical protein
VAGGTDITVSPITSANAVGGKSTCTIGNPFVDDDGDAVLGLSNVNITFTKTLNKETIPTDDDAPIVVILPIQSAALAYAATGITFSNNKVFTGDAITVTLNTSNYNNSQEYWYCWQKRSGTDTWTDVGNLTRLDTSSSSFNASFSNGGVYRLKVVAKYYKDSKESYTAATISVGSFNG